MQKQAQTGGDKAAKQTYEVLVRYKEALEQGKSARTVQFESKDEQKIAKELFLLTSKPVMYVCNVDEASAVNGNKYVEMVREAVKEENAEILVVAAKTEADIAELETYEDRQMFLQEAGLEESGVNRLIKAAYKTVGSGNIHHSRRNGSKKHGLTAKAGKLPNVPESSIPTLKKALSVPKSSNTKTIFNMVRKRPSRKPERWALKARNMWYRMATSCTSASMYKTND